MRTNQTIEDQLTQYEVWARKNGLKVVREPPFDRSAVERAEREFGTPLPPAYVEFVTQHGPFQISDDTGNAWRLIAPQESSEHIESFVQACLDEIDPEDPDSDEAKEWRREAQIRRRLYPFMMRDSSVHDFFCFYADRRMGEDLLIVCARHDDLELSDWLSSVEETPQSFLDFLAQEIAVPEDE